jgi:hypothetical protein
MRRSMGGALVCGNTRGAVLGIAGWRRPAVPARAPVQILPELLPGGQAFLRPTPTANSGWEAGAAALAGSSG